MSAVVLGVFVRPRFAPGVVGVHLVVAPGGVVGVGVGASRFVSRPGDEAGVVSFGKCFGGGGPVFDLVFACVVCAD